MHRRSSCAVVWTLTLAGCGGRTASHPDAPAGGDSAIGDAAVDAAPTCVPHAGAPHPRILEFGWDTPRTASDVAMLDLTLDPFDGTVLDPSLVLADGTSERGFSASVLVNEPLTMDTLARGQRTSGLLNAFAGFEGNLLRINAAGLDVAWNEDWTTVLANAQVAGALVCQYGLQGIVIDSEEYGSSTIWDPSHGSPADARARGRAFAASYGAAAPKTTILFTMAHSYVAAEQSVGYHGYDLLAPFIDGMMEGAPDSIVFVDGYEMSYSFRDRNGAWFPDTYSDGRQHITAARSLSLVPTLYDQRMKGGFGIWLDFNNTWDASNTANNYFTPAELATSLAAARDASDGWVWVYSQKISWYTSAATASFYAVPSAYRSDVTAARR
jgi:hypothetical protein